MNSLNGKLILKPYKTSGKIQSIGESRGFAKIKQRSALIGLEALATAQTPIKSEQVFVEKGQKVYFSEEVLHSAPWAKTTYTCDGIEGEFIIAESVQAIMVK